MRFPLLPPSLLACLSPIFRQPRHSARLLPSIGLLVLLAVGVTSAAAGAARGTEIRYLSGRGPDDAVEWDFKISDGRRSGEWGRIRVPSVWEQEGYGTYNYGIRYYGKPNPPAIAREQGIYRLDFDVPAEWQERRVRLVFEGSMTDTHVRLNGISMGPAHQGAFYRFSHEVSQWLKYGGSNHLEITVDKESANQSVNMAERRADYWNFGGIFRPVWLEVLPVHFIDRTAISARASGEFRAEVHLGEAVPAGRAAQVTGRILDPDGRPLGEAFTADVRAGSDHAELRTAVAAPRLWTAETPNLYSIEVSLAVATAGNDDPTATDVVTERFGFRTFEVREGQGLYLNGQRLLLKGINRHSFRPATGRSLSREDNYADVRLIKEMNMNAVRLSHYPPDPAFLEACDELGLYVLNELGGWHGAYDTGAGRPLVRALVTRDVNHPSILFWNNGNEGGWNPELDGEFHRWDPQRRPVLHPQKSFSGVETMHYRSYGEVQEYLRGREIYLPTEFLHGLYDGGHGAGLWDYWEMMREHPRSGGGFLWVLADEGIVRTDQEGRIDPAGNYGADGIVGPHHEREGSFYTVREIWSPVHLAPLGGSMPGAAAEKRQGSGVTARAVTSPVTTLPEGFEGRIQIENRYHFTNLSQCRLEWALARFAAPEARSGGHTVGAQGDIAGPDIAPGATGELRLPLPAGWRESDVLYVTARGPGGEALWTWSWAIEPARSAAATPPTAAASRTAASVGINETETEWQLAAGTLRLRFDKATGELAGVHRGEQPIALGAGPRFVAARRGDRSVDGWVAENLPKGVDRVYRPVAPPSGLTALRVRSDGADAVVEADYFGALRETRWRVSPDGAVRLDYAYRYDGVVELMGVHFDYPEHLVHSIRWLGRGPYRVWQNRRHGTRLDVWENDYNDSVPGESFIYPEFKGYFDDWRWATLRTTEAAVTVVNGSPGGYLGVFTPRDGRDALLFTLPETGLGLFDVIPAIRNKVNATDLVGPSSQPQRVSGERRRTVTFRFDPR